MNKLTKTAKVLDTICAILFWVLAIGGGAMVLFEAVTIPLSIFSQVDIPAEALQSAESVSVSLGDLDFVIPAECMKNGGNIVFSANYLMLMGVVAAAIGCITLKIIRNVLKPMKNGQPFAEQTAHSLRSLGWVTLIGGLITEVIRITNAYINFSSVNLEMLFNRDVVSQIGLNVDTDLSFIIEAVVLFVLSWIFRYGCELQQQVDETL